MTAIETPAPVATTIDHLDHDVPCQIRTAHSADDNEPTPCEQGATWWFVARAHDCTPDTTFDRFTCQHHMDWFLNGGEGRCEVCRELFEVRPTIIRTERIR